MKLNSKKNSTQAATSDPWNLKGRQPLQPVWKDPKEAERRIAQMRAEASKVYRTIAADGYPKYLDVENDPYARLVAPNPPTAEAVKRAQFVDKTYVWTGK